MKNKYIIVAWILSIVLSVYVGNAINILITPQYQGSQEIKTVYFAPYINSTHNCYNHGVSCTGELNNEDVSYIVASGDGSVLIENITITGSNGFFELSLQSQKSYYISLSININNTTHYGYTTFNTYQDGANCITTAKMFA